MEHLTDKTALVLGASAGIGKATVRRLAAAGARTVAVARGDKGLAELAATAAAKVEVVQADAIDPASAEKLLREFRPDLVVLAAGVRPHMAPLDEHTWASFSEAWNGDTQAAFHLARAALALPLAPGSTVAIVSSGAAIGGSSYSGGYAGAKRMQWLIADYAQQLSDRRGLGIRFLAIVPHQLVAGTEIAKIAATAYGALQGLSPEAFMERRFAVQMDADRVAEAIVEALGSDAPGGAALAITGTGIELLDSDMTPLVPVA